MVVKQFFAPCTLLALLTGCATDLYQPEYPAPVYGGGYPNTNPYPTQQPPVISKPPVHEDTVVTKPLKEPPPPIPREIAPDPVIEEPVAPQPVPEEKVDELPPLTEQPAPEVTSEPETPAPFTPLESNAHLSAPVGALVMAAKQSSESGNLESAGAAIERAIRIEPRNATLYYKLAVVRLNQSQPRLAEDLAKKSALLAANDTKLKKHSWLLIAKARELLSNPDGAKAALKKADSFN
jgi:hypothetical protein